MRVSLRQIVAGLCAALGMSVSASAANLLSEDFSGLSLQAYSSPTESGGDGTDWTDQLPAGWIATFNGPLGNPVEFQGWRVHDVDSWVATEGGQERQTWDVNPVGSHGSALVADPDAYDDGTQVDDKLFNASITTPPILIDLNVLQTAPGGTLSAAIDSFFRAEVTSDLYVDVSYDGGTTYSNLLTIESDNLPDGQTYDEHLEFPLGGIQDHLGGSLVLKFSLLEGSNDWWWALDNVSIDTVPIPEPSAFVLGGVALAAMFVARRARR